MKALIKKHPIASFLLINYLISWPTLYISYQIILAEESITPMALIGFIGAYGPSIAAIWVQYIIDKTQLKVLLGKLLRFKAKPKVYLYVIFLPILLYCLAYAASVLYQGEMLGLDVWAGLTSIPLWFLAALPFGPMGEELGWRGFMLPKLLEKHSILKSTLYVGLAWGVWHLASFTFPGAAIPSFLSVNVWTIGLYMLNTISLSILFTYIHFVSKASVFLAILLHAFFNAASNIALEFFLESSDTLTLTIAYILNMVLAAGLGLILLNGWKKKNGKLPISEK
ncbi:MAG: type II CAAX endopeptidase family protein [Bacteroidia bacterium]|nr:type II CAAX endopeptidase family protein [Bacteroidia bacterium]